MFNTIYSAFRRSTVFGNVQKPKHIWLKLNNEMSTLKYHHSNDISQLFAGTSFTNTRETRQNICKTHKAVSKSNLVIKVRLSF